MKRLLFSSDLLDLTVSRLCEQLIENYSDFSDTVLLGIQPRGTLFAERIHKRLETRLNKKIPFGKLDVTFYRDDFRRRDEPLKANMTDVPFVIENKKVILIDDVLYTGRTISAAMSAMAAFGRPKKVDLLVLIDRKYTRDLPIAPNYTGKTVNTILSEHIEVEWTQEGAKEDKIWLISENEDL
ncbi:bifunctional pyr operon transcriptional regulator/uracil phosphoribosyltransferase PyrR [Bernardetia sp.]|uniref:bifunctional pyr operon transcriptional regulator/uracil phosphoribosyltransferase PyrR n=1 Tax=Bernardetia sp. TaxID=1937974 RepID=UPI0025BA490B|nr:bifunctional pyr operon transcriptional regulator/uracil phosphoribosyltransferase PyrR [Bernardetia sp.]